MISSAKADDLAAISAFCEGDFLGAHILTQLAVYGFDSLNVSCAVAKNGETITGVILREGRLATVLAESSADFDELSSFLAVISPLCVSAYGEITERLGLSADEEAVIARFDCSREVTESPLCAGVTSENIALLYPCIFPFADMNSRDRDGWLTENSHKLRHGLTIGRAVFEDGRAVSCALAESLTERTAVIGSVSTLDGFRRRGYAAACVESVTAALAGSGREILLAYTNSGLSGLYSSLGFIPSDRFYKHYG